MPPSYYEIRIAGVVPPEALLDFERLIASVEPVETVLHGALLDQAALHGLLARLEMRVFLEQWLQRIPDFRITPGGVVRTSSGAVNGVLTLPLTWH